MYEKLTLCIYGLPYIGTEGHLLLETAKNDVPLEKLQNISEDFYYLENSREKINLTNDDIEILNTHTIESLISPYIKCEVMGGLKKAYYINPPNVNMIEKLKTGYIYYENDLIYYTQCLNNFYLTIIENKSNKSIAGKMPVENIKNNLDEITFQTYFKKISDIIKILISKNLAFLEQDCVFREDNNEIFYKIPESLIDIILLALEGKNFGYPEIKSSLNLLKIISNSSYLVDKFIEKGGMEMLYGLILTKEEKDSLFGVALSNQCLAIKIIVLENIYRLLTHKSAFTKFMENIDKNKLQQQYFKIREYLKDAFEANDGNVSTIVKDSISERDLNISAFSFPPSSSKKKSKGLEREKDRDKKKSKKEKKSKKDRRVSKSKSDRSRSRDYSRDGSRERSKHRSRDRSRDRSRTYSKEDSSDYSNLHKKKDKKHAKNVLLKNGYQIILTLIIGKRNHLIINMVKKIINKVSFLIYLKEIKNVANFVQKVI
jgi:hypothetical protein